MNENTYINRRVLLISGTPASGKDTLTNVLCKQDPRFAHFKKHKMGETGRVDDTYIFVGEDQFNKMVKNGEFIQHHYRYGRGYAVAYSELDKYWSNNLIPVIHVGKYENISAFYNDDRVSVYSLLLLVNEDVTKERLTLRHRDDKAQIAERLKAYHEERKELADLIKSGQPLLIDYVINNSKNVNRAIDMIKGISI